MSYTNTSDPNIKYIKVDSPNPFEHIDQIYTDTILLPDLSNYQLSNTQSLSDWMFSEFFDNLIFNFMSFPSMGTVCTVYYQRVEEYFLRINLTTLELTISNNTINQIQNCINSGVQFIILPIRLDFLDIETDYNINVTDTENTDQIQSSHSNLLIIDTVWKTIDFFEPHGIVLTHAYSNIIHLQEAIENFVKKLFGIYDYTFVNIANTCPLGLQSLQSITDPTSGHCLVWSLYFITVRLMNTNYIKTDMTKTLSQNINELLVVKIPDADTTIKQFLSYIESFIITPTRLHNTDSKYDFLYFLNDTVPIENRLRYLIRIYFFNIVFYNRDLKKIFQEIISYKNLKNFDKIFIEEMTNNLSTYQSSYFDQYLNLD